MEKHDFGQGIKKRCYYNNNHMREWRVGNKSFCDPPARTVTQLTDLSIEVSAFFSSGVVVVFLRVYVLQILARREKRNDFKSD